MSEFHHIIVSKLLIAGLREKNVASLQATLITSSKKHCLGIIHCFDFAQDSLFRAQDWGSGGFTPDKPLHVSTILDAASGLEPLQLESPRRVLGSKEEVQSKSR